MRVCGTETDVRRRVRVDLVQPVEYVLGVSIERYGYIAQSGVAFASVTAKSTGDEKPVMAVGVNYSRVLRTFVFFRTP